MAALPITLQNRMAVSNSLFVHFPQNESYTDIGNRQLSAKKEGRKHSFLEELYITMQDD
jgi:hypothetical protein